MGGVKPVKVGILTFHEGINHGAFFQAYFLQQYLKIIGADVQIINYKNKKHWISEYKSFLYTKNIVQLVRNLRKISAFRFDQRAMKRFPQRLTTNPKIVQRISSEYDYLIVGSDIVWDYAFSFTGNDAIYFGEGLKPVKGLISYAASMGRASDTPPQYALRGLGGFNRISVRDDNTKRIVENHTSQKAEKVIDPTLLIDFEKISPDLSSCKNNPVSGKYILIYAYLLPIDWRSAIERFASKNDLKIIVVGYRQRISGSNKTHVGPFEWFDYFRNAEFVITSTFHGTIFSILNRKRFLTIANSSIEYKAGSLLRYLNIHDRYITGEFQPNKLEDSINWGDVNRCLIRLRTSSQHFLKSALRLSEL